MAVMVRHGLRAVLRVAAVGALVISAGVVGCVERTVTINTEPEGATVILNDQEVGRSPVRVPFTWYGDYDIILRKEGFETIRTNRRIPAPWYQFPIIDIVAECMVPFTVHDDHTLETFVLKPREEPPEQVLLDSAGELRRRAAAP